MSQQEARAATQRDVEFFDRALGGEVEGDEVDPDVVEALGKVGDAAILRGVEE